MKVILLKDVAKIGRKSAVVEVPDGFALNKLIPSKLAEAATPINLKKIEKLQSDLKSSNEADTARFNSIKVALTENIIKIPAEVNEKGHAFKAVNENEIAKAAQAIGVTIEPAMIMIAKPIKEVGQHEIELVLGNNKTNLIIEVVKK